MVNNVLLHTSREATRGTKVCRDDDAERAKQMLCSVIETKLKVAI